MLRNFKAMEYEVVLIPLEYVHSHDDVRKTGHFKLIKNNFLQNVQQ